MKLIDMKKFSSLLFISFITCFSYSSFALSSSCKVVGVVDGDTIKCLFDNKKLIKIRLANIDAPESKQAFGQVSKYNLSKLIFDKIVQVDLFEKDKYNRLIGKISYQNRDINLEQVKQGYAWVYREFNKNPEYYVAELDAKKNKRGLWLDKYPIYPSIWRKTHP